MIWRGIADLQPVKFKLRAAFGRFVCPVAGLTRNAYVTLPHRGGGNPSFRKRSLTNWRQNLAWAIYLALIAVATVGWLWLLAWMVKNLV